MLKNKLSTINKNITKLFFYFVRCSSFVIKMMVGGSRRYDLHIAKIHIALNNERKKKQGN